MLFHKLRICLLKKPSDLRGEQTCINEINPSPLSRLARTCLDETPPDNPKEQTLLEGIIPQNHSTGVLSE